MDMNEPMDQKGAPSARRRSASRAVAAGLAVVCVGGAVALTLVGKRNVERSLETGMPVDCRAVVGWIDKERPPLGAGANDLALPKRLAKLSVDATAHVLVTDTASRCLLLKTSIGWKDNFEGDLCCEAPLPPDSAGAGSKPIVSVGDPPFEELYVRERMNPHWAKVYFDLN